MEQQRKSPFDLREMDKIIGTTGKGYNKEFMVLWKDGSTSVMDRMEICHYAEIFTAWAKEFDR